LHLTLNVEFKVDTVGFSKCRKSNLPFSPKERLEQLFLVKRKWLAEDLIPFIEDMAENKKKLDVLLLKYARVSNSEGRVYYTSRLA
jgi:sister chromatid cohesion protein DCC1